MIEESVGIGQVINVQENGLIQIRESEEGSNHAALWQPIRGRKAASLSRFIVKPSIDFNAAGIKVRFDG
jgi:hypothetical protein